MPRRKPTPTTTEAAASAAAAKVTPARLAARRDLLRRPGMDSGSVLEGMHLRNHVLVLGVGLSLYAADVLVAWLAGHGYAGDLALRLATLAFGGYVLAGLALRGRVVRSREVVALAVLGASSVVHLALSAYAGGLGADVLLRSGLWLYLLYVYAYGVLGPRTGLLWGLGAIVVTTVALAPLWPASEGAERWAFAYFQAGGFANLVIGFGLAGWRRAYVAAQERIEEAEYESLTDALTGQPNRRALRFNVSREIARARRTARPFAVLILDIDHFKDYNDTYGHAVGDAVLRELSGVVRGALREGDEFGRLGGEEFVVVAPDTDRSDALLLAGRLRLALHEHDWPFRPVRASIGVTVSQPGDTIEQLFERADTALYRAKEGGRDRSELVLADGAAGSVAGGEAPERDAVRDAALMAEAAIAKDPGEAEGTVST